MEGAADAGEIVVSETTAAALRAADLGAAKGPGRLLRRRAPLDGCVDIDRCAGGSPAGPRPVALHPRRAARARCWPTCVNPSTGSSPSRSSTTAGTDAMLEQLGAGASPRALEQLVVVVQHAADRQDVAFLGTDIDADGGKIILTAGVPTTSGDDEDAGCCSRSREIADADLDLPSSWA